MHLPTFVSAAFPLTYLVKNKLHSRFMGSEKKATSENLICIIKA